METFDKGKTYEYVDAFVSKSSNFNYTNEFDNNLYNNNYISKSTSFSNLENNSLRLIQQSYNERISKLYKDFEGYYKEILKKNINDIINEQIFIEKEKEISNLITKNALLVNENDTIKLENTRLEKVISVLEIDIKKMEKKINTLKAENSQIKINSYGSGKYNIEVMNNMINDYKEKILLLQKENERLRMKSITNGGCNYSMKIINEIHQRNLNLKNELIAMKRDIERQCKEVKEINYDSTMRILQAVNESLQQKAENEKMNSTMLEQFNIIEKCQKENKKLIMKSDEDLHKIKELSQSQNSLEKENKELKNQIIKLNVQIEVLNEALQHQQQSISFSSNQKSEITELVSQLKKKYEQQIDLLKNQLKDKETQTKNEYLNIIKEKDFKITQLETALNQSLISLNSGMENVKIANQLDSEIKQFISKV